jgi:hypothetical protein
MTTEIGVLGNDDSTLGFIFNDAEPLDVEVSVYDGDNEFATGTFKTRDLEKLFYTLRDIFDSNVEFEAMNPVDDNG